MGNLGSSEETLTAPPGAARSQGESRMDLTALVTTTIFAVLVVFYVIRRRDRLTRRQMDVK